MRALALCLIVLAGAGPAHAACRLALAMGLDVSSSVDAREDLLQRQGLAAALRAPEVAQAFFDGSEPVAIAVYEWSGQVKQHLILDWALIETPDDLAAASATISASQRIEDSYPTSMGPALGYGANLLARRPDCLRHVIDLSGDGVHNDSYPPRTALRVFPFEGVVINGLVILGTDEDVAGYYRREVVRGPGAIVVVARSFDDFERAMRIKLQREVTALAIGALPAPPEPRG